MNDRSPLQDDDFAAEVERVRASGELGESGRLAELFDYLAARGSGAAPASQAELAEGVFGQTETSFDDATVRVYIHRLRKRLKEFYQKHGEGPGATRLTVPPGIYALRLVVSRTGVAPEADSDAREDSPAPTAPLRRGTLALAVAAIVLVALAAFMLGRALPAGERINALWQPLVASERPTLIVLGDYYIFGEIDPVRPDEGRLIRDFRVNSPTDLARMQELQPEQFGVTEDVGLSYLPFSSAYGLREIVPLLSRREREVRVIAASDFAPDMLNTADVVYIGLFSGMGLLEGVVFAGSGFAIGESYDELVDAGANRTFVSEEARRLASSAFYDDYGYVARFRAPGGALVAVVAGARETGLRGAAQLAAREELAEQIDRLAESEGALEALFQITGQQGARLSERLVVARPREAQR